MFYYMIVHCFIIRTYLTCNCISIKFFFCPPPYIRPWLIQHGMKMHSMLSFNKDITVKNTNKLNALKRKLAKTENVVTLIQNIR